MIEIFTLGHSNQTLEYVVSLLLGYEIEQLTDIRRFPYSRFPYFNGDVLAPMLEAVGLRYVHQVGLGGRRSPRKDSPHLGWSNTGFRGFADYMETTEFRSELAVLIRHAKQRRVAYMCSEAVPWRCHRSLIADALELRGIAVYHIMSRTTATRHILTPWAKIEGSHIIYAKSPSASPT